MPVNLLITSQLTLCQNTPEPDGLVPESAPVSVAPTSSPPRDSMSTRDTPRDVSPATRDVAPATRDVAPATREVGSDREADSPKPDEEPQFCKARCDKLVDYSSFPSLLYSLKLFKPTKFKQLQLNHDVYLST